MSSSSPVEAALQAADEAIRQAEQESSTPNSQTDTNNDKAAAQHDAERNSSDLTNKGDAHPDSSSADNAPDPDDLAAAFFAAQAKKQEAESRLPIKEWTQLFPGLRLQGTSSSGEGRIQREYLMTTMKVKWIVKVICLSRLRLYVI